MKLYVMTIEKNKKEIKIVFNNKKYFDLLSETLGYVETKDYSAIVDLIRDEKDFNGNFKEVDDEMLEKIGNGKNILNTFAKYGKKFSDESKFNAYIENKEVVENGFGYM